MLLRYKIPLILLLLCCAVHCNAQYGVQSLCKVASQFDDSTPRCVVLLRIPPNTVRLMYSIGIDEKAPPPFADLETQATAMLPEKLGWLGIAGIAEKVKGVAKNGNLVVCFYDNKRCVQKFAKRANKNCKARWQQDSCRGGTFDIPWQATLFPEKYYLCLINPQREIPVHFTIEAIAIVAQ